MNLLYFLLGILFVHIITPLLEAVLSLLLIFIEMCSTKLKVIINKDQLKIKQADEGSYPQTGPIGFTADTENKKEK